MSNLVKAREIIKLTNELAIYLTEDEISEIGIVLLNAVIRMDKEKK
jgi:hypothetical protein